MAVRLDSRLWQRGRPHEVVTHVESEQIALNWHGCARGASLVSAYHAVLTGTQTKKCLVPGPNALDVKTRQVISLPHLAWPGLVA